MPSIFGNFLYLVFKKINSMSFRFYREVGFRPLAYFFFGGLVCIKSTLKIISLILTFINLLLVKISTFSKLSSKHFLTVEKSSFVDAPVIKELPMTLECKLIKFDDNGNIIADIVNVSADEAILNDKGKIDPLKLQPISYDSVGHKYLKVSEVVGNAFEDGKALK